MQDNLLTYPFVRKEEFESIQLENQKLREQIDVMYAEFNQLKGFLDMGMLDINTLIEYSIGKKTKATEEEIAKIEKRLKDISNIDKVSKLTSDNIKYKVELNDKDKIISNLNNGIKLLQQELDRVVNEQKANEERDKKTIFNIRNADDMMKQKLNENEQLEFKNNELKSLNDALQKDLAKKAYKLGYGETMQKPMIAYAPNSRGLTSGIDDKLISRKLRKIKKLLKSRYFRTKKTEKAKQVLFEIKQSIALMPDENKKQYEQMIRQFDEVLNVS